MPSYQAVRKAAGGFMALCKNPDAVCDVTLQPIDQFDLDAAIIFSDILTLPEAMAVDLRFIEGVGPVVHHPIRTATDVAKRTHQHAYEQTGYVYEAIQKTQRALNKRVPLLGFSGSPWTLACYMVEGKLTKNLDHIKTLRYQDPDTLNQLLDVLEHNIFHYCVQQIEAGVDALMLFDTWGGALSFEDYPTFSLMRMQRIIRRLKQHHTTPIVLFTKGAQPWWPEILATDCDGVGIDYSASLQQAKATFAGKKAIQGNLDPHILLAPPEVMQTRVNAILDVMADVPGFIFNLGHGILKTTDPARVKDLVHMVRFYTKYHP